MATKTTKLARKKLNQIFQLDSKTQFEISIRNSVLYGDLIKTSGGVLCTEPIVSEMCRKASDYGIDIIGIETSINTDIPLQVFAWEEYAEYDDSPFWCTIPLLPLFSLSPELVLRFYIDIPVENLEHLSRITGIEI